MSRLARLLAIAPLLALAHPQPAAANPAMIDYVRGQITAMRQSPEIMEAIRDANARHAALPETQLVAMDAQWRGEIGASEAPTISAIVESTASQRLRAMAQDSGGVVTEIIVMDNRGMNAATSAVTSDYWQGDEAKFIETFPRGPAGLHVGEVEYDESTNSYQVQVSTTLVDPVTGQPAGAVTFGLDATAF
ncbi:hypothetical protein [Jannaschia ovalis]|uniref:DUF3887 domain-containing protein n=1 Tax=Jannaschia ovalis TaxID=3038773 RepID=A0ABY8LHK5_9RHOB|nr:hypothetical protein [Jannaschia sp. GRR-S6-38]WGH80147.1 hypothetical protein P8627_07740 [Jannaschia sp. GRR-S6-38]